MERLDYLSEKHVLDIIGQLIDAVGHIHHNEMVHQRLTLGKLYDICCLI